MILAGSCSQATRAQIDAAIVAGTPALKLDPMHIAAGRQRVSNAVDWALAQKDRVPLIYSSADPDEVKTAQAALGRERAGALVEAFLAEAALALRDAGVRRLIVAGVRPPAPWLARLPRKHCSSVRRSIPACPGPSP